MSNRYAAYTKLKLDYPSKRILRLTFDRPETYNSVDAETHTQLTHIWRDINDDPDINAVIVTGAGKAFSAGGDFELIKSILDNPVARMATWKEAKDLVYNVINCNKPIISAINGVAVGAGLVVGILADVSICGKSAKMFQHFGASLGTSLRDFNLTMVRNLTNVRIYSEHDLYYLTSKRGAVRRAGSAAGRSRR